MCTIFVLYICVYIVFGYFSKTFFYHIRIVRHVSFHTIYALFSSLLETQKFCVEKKTTTKMLFYKNFPSNFDSFQCFRATNGHLTQKRHGFVLKLAAYF